VYRAKTPSPISLNSQYFESASRFRGSRNICSLVITILSFLLVATSLWGEALGRSDFAVVPAQETSTPEQEEVSRKDVQAAADCPGGTSAIPSGWSLSKASVQANVLKATQSQQTYQGELVFVGNWNPGACGYPHQRTLAEFLAGYDSKQGSKPGSIVNRSGDLRLQHLFFVPDNARFVSINADGYHNTSLGLYAQESIGLGVGTLIGSLELDADVRFVDERFYGPTESAKLFGTLLSERYSLPIGNAVVTETLQLLPVFNKSNAWQARGILALAVPLSRTFSLTVSAFDDYLDNAPSSFHKNYFKTTVGVQFSPVSK
jgi:Protein of unknown function, DUF481